ncbi:helix-turn-helix domain-containing protein [Kitasatospora sp. NPDC088779]|uniref:helix-turn-helix domain-containing protein n=1 Tax=Kitasatospora sp. NPDC088779 TaxID=3154964 RepID=UPI00344A1E5D
MGTVGDRVRELRKRAGLTQRELAKAAGVSFRTVENLEQGRGGTPRLETLHKLAVPLRTTTSHLQGEYTEAGNPDAATVDRWTAVRGAILGPPPVVGPEESPPSVAGVQTLLREVTPLFSGDRFAELATVLPPLLHEAELLGAEGRRVRVRLLQLAGWLMVQTRQFEAAEVALTRALDDSADKLEGAATVNTMCWLLLRQGRLAAARELAVKWSDDLEPRMSRATPDELSAWGWALLRVSAASVRDGRPGDAADALRLAHAAAVALGREHAPGGDFLRTFGPTTVAMKRAENASVVQRPDEVLRLAALVPPGGLRPTSNNWNRHLLDVANAQVEMRNYSRAVEVLTEIRNNSPQWLPNQRFARDILGRVVRRRRQLTPEIRELADTLRLPAGM